MQGTLERIAVLTSGGDAPGMNAAVRAVVRAGLAFGLEVLAIRDGYAGLVLGDDDGSGRVRSMGWEDVGGILQLGGTALGSARSEAFRTREGRLQAARTLVQHRIDGLVVIGGDGSLTGAQVLHDEWPELVQQLREDADPEVAKLAVAAGELSIVGLVASIDNDMWGVDMTIGCDTALHRISEAVDAINSTAASHQRTFVVQVMGRNCGYLALMGALITGADWLLIPENPPEPGWQDRMYQSLKQGRAQGRRATIVMVAEGVHDREGHAVGAEQVAAALEERFLADGVPEEVRVTILGHVQRGGSPTAFDRIQSTLLGHAAVRELEREHTARAPHVLSLRGAKVSSTPLAETLSRTRGVADAIASGQYAQARRLRGAVFRDAFRIVHTFLQPAPSGSTSDGRTLRLGVLHCGAPAAGMNTAVRAAVRLGLERGHEMVGIRDGFDGLIHGHVEPLSWMRVNGWASYGGAELGTSRTLPGEHDMQSISGTLREHSIDGLLIIGGWDGYEAAGRLKDGQRLFREFRIPIVCLPATISCNLPGTEVSIGADTALNNIIEAVDKIKHSAVAARRCFLVEVAGRYCGYLALMSGLATGAERVYLPEEGVTLDDLQRDLRRLIQGFSEGRRLALVIRNERVNELYDTAFMTAVFEQESVGFSARQSILGYLQHGGDPSALDRIQATLLAARSLEHLLKEAERGEGSVSCAGILRGSICFYSLAEFHTQADEQHLRPQSAWWMRLRPVARVMAQRSA